MQQDPWKEGKGRKEQGQKGGRKMLQFRHHTRPPANQHLPSCLFPKVIHSHFKVHQEFSLLYFCFVLSLPSRIVALSLAKFFFFSLRGFKWLGSSHPSPGSNVASVEKTSLLSSESRGPWVSHYSTLSSYHFPLSRITVLVSPLICLPPLVNKLQEGRDLYSPPVSYASTTPEVATCPLLPSWSLLPTASRYPFTLSAAFSVVERPPQTGLWNRKTVSCAPQSIQS